MVAEHKVPTEAGWYLVRVEDVGEVAEWGPMIADMSYTASDMERRVWFVHRDDVETALEQVSKRPQKPG